MVHELYVCVIPSESQSLKRIPFRTGWGRNVGFIEYGDSWRDHRRLFHQHFRPKAVPLYHPKITQEVRKLLRFLDDAPGAFAKHFR